MGYMKFPPLGLSGRVEFLGNAYWDVFFSKNVSDPVIESFRNARDLKVWPQNPQRNPQPANTEWSYLKIPYIS